MSLLQKLGFVTAVMIVCRGPLIADEAFHEPLRAVDESRRDLPFADVTVISRMVAYVVSSPDSSKSLKDAVVHYRILRDDQRALVKFDQIRPYFKDSPRMSNAWAYDGEILRIDRWGLRSNPSDSEAILGKEIRLGSGVPISDIRTNHVVSALFDYRYFGIWNQSFGSHRNFDSLQAKYNISDRLEGDLVNLCSLPGITSKVLASEYGPSFTRLLVESTIDPLKDSHQVAIRYLIDIDMDRRVVVRYEAQSDKTVEDLQNPKRIEVTESEWVSQDFGGRSHVVPKRITYTVKKAGAIVEEEISDVTVKFIDPTQLDPSSFGWAALEMQPGNHIRFEDGHVQQWDGHEFVGMPPTQAMNNNATGSAGMAFWWPILNLVVVCGFLVFWLVTKYQRRRKVVNSAGD